MKPLTIKQYHIQGLSGLIPLPAVGNSCERREFFITKRPSSILSSQLKLKTVYQDIESAIITTVHNPGTAEGKKSTGSLCNDTTISKETSRSWIAFKQMDMVLSR